MRKYHIEIIADTEDRQEIEDAFRLFIVTKIQGAKLVSVLKEVSEEELIEALTDG